MKGPFKVCKRNVRRRGRAGSQARWPEDHAGWRQNTPQTLERINRLHSQPPVICVRVCKVYPVIVTLIERLRCPNGGLGV